MCNIRVEFVEMEVNQSNITDQPTITPINGGDIHRREIKDLTETNTSKLHNTTRVKTS